MMFKYRAALENPRVLRIPCVVSRSVVFFRVPVGLPPHVESRSPGRPSGGERRLRSACQVHRLHNCQFKTFNCQLSVDNCQLLGWGFVYVWRRLRIRGINTRWCKQVAVGHVALARTRWPRGSWGRGRPPPSKRIDWRGTCAGVEDSERTPPQR